jgi:3'(2'), 5'-bisphosphate nucleotidase
MTAPKDRNLGDCLEAELTAAREIVRAAWGKVRGYYRGTCEVFQKEDGPATQADREASAFIVAELRRRFPADGVLSEEADDDGGRLACERVWMIDPIDGTKDFIERKGSFAVQIGLAIGDGEKHVSRLGVVYHPVADRLYFARHGGGAWVETPAGETCPLTVSKARDLSEMTVVATRSHRSPLFLDLLDLLGPREIITMGSLGLKVMRVAEGRADYYLNNSRGQSWEWDLCAPEAILREAGGTVTDLDGNPFRYNREKPRLEGGILASNGSCHETLRRRALEMEALVKTRAAKN